MEKGSYPIECADVLEKLVTKWEADLLRLTTQDAQEVAYDMVQHYFNVGSDDCTPRLDELYPLVEEVFELAASLELPMGTNEFGTQAEINNAWERVKVCVNDLRASLS